MCVQKRFLISLQFWIWAFDLKPIKLISPLIIISQYTAVLEMKIWIYWIDLNIVLNKSWKIYWSKQSFTDLGPEDRSSLWGLHSTTCMLFQGTVSIFLMLSCGPVLFMNVFMKYTILFLKYNYIWFQTTGKAEYINDTPAQQHELYAAFVISTVGNAKLQSMDPSKALVCTFIAISKSILNISYDSRFEMVISCLKACLPQ